MDESKISNCDVNDDYIHRKLKVNNFDKNGLYVSNSLLEPEKLSGLVQTIKNSPVWKNVEILHDSRVIVKQKVNLYGSVSKEAVIGSFICFFSF
jgi:hypothetical protein